MSRLDDIRDLLARAETLECVENTYIPARAGLRLRPTRVGRTVAEGIQLNGPHEGEPFRLVLPTRVADVVAVDACSATYLLDRKLERLNGHSVTYRVVSTRPGG